MMIVQQLCSWRKFYILKAENFEVLKFEWNRVESETLAALKGTKWWIFAFWSWFDIEILYINFRLNWKAFILECFVSHFVSHE